MLRWMLALGGVMALVWSTTAAAQVCRRVCRAGEVRDANRCCIKRPLRHRGTGSLRLEADVRRARVRVGRRSLRVRLPATLRHLRRGHHAVTIRAAGKVWRGGVDIKPGKTAHLFASVAGGEWPLRRGDAKKARRILDAALAAKGGARLRKLRSVEYSGKTSPQGTLWAGATQHLFWVRPGKLSWQWTQRLGGTTSQSTMTFTPLARWIVSRGMGTRTVRTGQPSQKDLDGLWQWPDRILLRHTQPGTRVALLPPARIDGARVDVVQIARSPKGASRARLYINRATKMLVRIQPIDEFGNFGPVTELSHYRRVAGIAFAHRWHYHNMWIDWQRIGIDQPLPAGLFVPPKQKRSAASATDVRTRETLRWQQPVPQLADFNRDGTLDLYGACEYRRVETRPTGKQKRQAGYYVCGVDGDKLVERWRIGPFSHKLRVTPAVAGRIGVVFNAAAGRSVMDIYSLRSKRRLRRVRLSDRVKRQCAGPRRRRLWLELADGNHRVIDMRTGASRRGNHASWCRYVPAGCPSGRRSARCATPRERKRLDKVPGFSPRFVLVAHEGTRLGVGHKSPGSRVPMVVAYDRMGRMYWQHRGFERAAAVAPTHVDASGGAVFVAYWTGARKRRRLVSLSLRNGKRRWSTALPMRHIAGMRVAGGRVYVTSQGARQRLIVLDAHTGKTLATIGYRSRIANRTVKPSGR